MAEDPSPTVLFQGTKPRDPLADLLFCGVFGAGKLHLVASLDRAKLQITLLPSSSTMFPAGADLAGLPPFAFMDDFFIPFEADSPQELASHLLLLAQVVQCCGSAPRIDSQLLGGKD